MDRFEYGEVVFNSDESVILRETGAKIYDGDNKTSFEGGLLELTTHRLIWSKSSDCRLILHLMYVVYVEEERSGFAFSRSIKFILHLTEPLPGKPPGPVTKSVFNHVKIAFKDKSDSNFLNSLREALQLRKWHVEAAPHNQISHKAPPIKIRTGIVGIERQIHEKHKETDENISKAFQDLSKLMVMAKDMVNLSRTISQKIRDKQGDITEDETVRFKSYLLSLGIDDPVTRNSFKNDSQFHEELAKQIADMLENPIKIIEEENYTDDQIFNADETGLLLKKCPLKHLAKNEKSQTGYKVLKEHLTFLKWKREVGGMMGLADVYCRVNRARGLELLSPEDLLNACNLLGKLNLPVFLREFESGVKVLQLLSHSDEKIIEITVAQLKERNSMTAEELAQEIGIPVLLAKERLVAAEKNGRACRDDSIEGLRFYPNLFLEVDR